MQHTHAQYVTVRFDALVDLVQFAIQYGTGEGCTHDEAASLLTSWQQTA
jgi:hypothetical protein